MHNDRVIATSDDFQHRLFSYDPVGNLSSEICLDSEEHVLEQKDYFYSDTAQLKGIKNAYEGTELNFEHDFYGRLTRKGNQSFAYGFYNMMTSFADSNVEASYDYDSRTRLRASKTVNSQTMRFVLDNSQRVIQELDQENKIISEIIYGEKGPQTYI